MELYQIRHFIAVAEAGGFTKGAQRIAVSQPAISASISKLEDELKIQLLERRHTHVVLTPAGIHLLEVGKAILRRCDSLKGEIKTNAGRRVLTIGILHLLSAGRVARLLTAFQCANTQIRVEVIESCCDCEGSCPRKQFCGAFPEEELDAALTIFNGGELKCANRALFTMPYMLAVREDHRFAERQAVSLCELVDLPFIVPARCIYLRDVMNILTCRGIDIRVVYRTDHDDTALTLVRAGLGLAFVPGYFREPFVKQVPLMDLGVSRTVGLVWSHERENSALKEFIEFAARHCWGEETLADAVKPTHSLRSAKSTTMIAANG